MTIDELREEYREECNNHTHDDCDADICLYHLEWEKRAGGGWDHIGGKEVPCTICEDGSCPRPTAPDRLINTISPLGETGDGVKA